MSKEYVGIRACSLQTGAGFVRPMQNLPELVKLSTAALEVMTDLTKVSVISVRAKTSLDRANAKMIRYGVRLLLVLDDNDNRCVGRKATDLLANYGRHA
jgi:CBS-domain-containing membrane protein